MDEQTRQRIREGYEKAPWQDGMADILAEQAKSAQRLRQAQGIDVDPALDVIPAGPDWVVTGPILQHIRIKHGVWPPWQSPHSYTLALVPLRYVPQLKDRLTPDECYQHDGQPCVVLGDTQIRSGSAPGQYMIRETYHALPAYRIESALRWTRHLRDAQIEKEHAEAGPGRRHKQLERELAELKEQTR